MDSGAPVLCDRRATHQCLLNLLSNAVKFSKWGGTVVLRVASDPTHARLDIADAGPGIAPEIVEQIGQPFVRSTDPAVASIEGTGLGLAITQSLMSRQGGRLRIETEFGKGTTATLELPLVSPAKRHVNV